MKNRIFKKILSVLFAMCLFTTSVFAYFQFVGTKSFILDISTQILNTFDKLDSSVNPTGAYGTTGNPYIINTQRHLLNLYKLQSSGKLDDINGNYVFQVSDKFGKPCYVGGTSTSALFEMPSIGSEAHPFINTFRGVRTTNSADYITLPTGEVSDTSVIGDVKVVAVPDQIDIGLFSRVGVYNGSAPQNAQGKLENILLCNVQISTTITGVSNSNHPNYLTADPPHETNHIGIFVGHAENCFVNNISVYYSQNGQTGKATVGAFDISANDTNTRYTTTGGIFGYYKDIIVNGEIEFPMTSSGSDNYTKYGSGFGTGIFYSEDIWSFMERNYFNSMPAPNPSYSIRDTFDEAFYGQGNVQEDYFRIGVFTFVHSSQTRDDDKITKLWATSSDSQWTVATNNSYTSQSIPLATSATKYVCTRLTTSDFVTTGTGAAQRVRLDLTKYPLADYRIMIVATRGGAQYALTKYGYTASPQVIDTNNFVIETSQLNYYTCQPMGARQANTNFPPYNQFAFEYITPVAMQIDPLNDNTVEDLYMCYGQNRPDTGTGKRKEGLSPFRVVVPTGFAFPNQPDSAKAEALRIRSLNGNQFNFGGKSGATRLLFDPVATNGEYMFGTDVAAQSTFEMYAVRITPNSSNPSESPQSQTLYKTVNNPSNSNNTITYDTSNNVLFYTGTASSTDNATKYSYQIKSLASLGWLDNQGNVIHDIDTKLKMADPSIYSVITGGAFGMQYGIPTANFPPPFSTVDVPQGVLAFTVTGHGIANGPNLNAKIYAILATDPYQWVDQTINLSYFPYTTTPASPAAGQYPTSVTYSTTKTVLAQVALPPVPTISNTTTKAIVVKDGNNSYIAYPNMNTLLVAYEFNVPVTRYPTTYFLEATKGSANFVYFASEGVSAGSNNPSHKNDAVFNALPKIDFVMSRNNQIETVQNPNYLPSLMAPYFGMTRNGSNLTGISGFDILAILNAKNLNYNIYRTYDTNLNLPRTNISVTLPSYPSSITSTQLHDIMAAMNFNFTEWTYINKITNVITFADYVNTQINGLQVDWSQLNDLYP